VQKREAIKCRGMMARNTSGSLREVKDTMEDDTTRGMASSFYPYIGRNPRELVYRPGYAQRHQIMDRITT
jgi:hypothetical protein